MTMAFPTVVFQSFCPSDGGWTLAFERPEAVHCTHDPAQVPRLLDIAHRAAASAGKWVAVALSYEAAPAFDRAYTVHAASPLPVAWIAVFDRPVPVPVWPDAGAVAVSDWECDIDQAQYTAAVARIRQHIASGDTYQVNYTVPLRARFQGDARTWFQRLAGAQGAAFSAWFDLGRWKILSFSPELFFERVADRIVTRPMKGTLHRGRWAAEDAELAAELAACPKNRAENLMIVDLIRNDLGRIALPGSVRTRRLFAVERLENVLQMTSTVEARCAPETTLADAMRALFPCGSITGAPKIRTMRIIADLERGPRGFYTGALGFVKPGGDCLFNVAIRTVILDEHDGRAEFGVGGGITIDSRADDEFNECRIKARFLHECRPEMRLLESILLEDGAFFLGDRHMARLREAVAYFRFDLDADALTRALDDVRHEHPAGAWKVRVLTNRFGAIAVEAQPLPPSATTPERVAFARTPVDPMNRFLYHKTTRRELYDSARAERPDCADVILWNARGEVTESCLANVVALKDGVKRTPPLVCGLLPGTFRAELLATGEIREEVLDKDSLRRADALFLINSVRRWRPAMLVE